MENANVVQNVRIELPFWNGQMLIVIVLSMSATSATLL
jgi:hypothetical protein